MAAALDGIRVLELAAGVGGPYCGKLLAGFGADVIKVEPSGGDSTRRDGPFPADESDPSKSGLFLHLNTGKRGGVSATAGALRELLAGADVLLLSHQPADLAKAGLTIDQLRLDYPRIVIVDVTPFGLTGPYATFAGGELVAYALGGYMMLTGPPDRPPIKSYGSLVEYEAGAHAALGTMAALFAREFTGQGQLVDVAAMEAATFMLGGVEQTAHFYGGIVRRNGTRLLGYPPEQPYPSTIRPCLDGFVHAHSHNRLRDMLAAMIPHPRLLDPELLAKMTGHADEIDEIMDEWLTDKTRAEVFETAQELRLPFTPVLAPGEVMADPHNIARGSFTEVTHPGGLTVRQPAAPIRMRGTPWVTGPAPAIFDPTGPLPGWMPRTDHEPAPANPAAGLTGPKPLCGVRVLEITNAVAGPTAGFILADLGADVIKVEATNGRPLKGAGTAPLIAGGEDLSYNRVMNFNELNHGKRGISVNLTKPEGRDIFLRLIAKSDIFVENSSPRVLGNLRIDYDDLREVNPAIIVVRMPAFGLDGPYREKVSYGPGVDAMSGFSHLTGYADGAPMKPGNFFCDQNAGVHAAFAALTAYRHRRRTGEGQLIELAMIEGEFQILGDAYMDYSMNARERMRSGNDHPRMAPHDVYPCSGEDAWIAIAVQDDARWRAMCEVIRHPEFAHDPRFAKEADRHANRAVLHAPISAWTSQRTHYEAQAALQAAGVAAGAVLNALELLGDPHVVAREGFNYVDVPNVGPAPYPRVAFTLSETPVPIEMPAPGFAQHNDEVYGQLLGLSREEIEALTAERVISPVPLAVP